MHTSDDEGRSGKRKKASSRKRNKKQSSSSGDSDCEDNELVDFVNLTGQHNDSDVEEVHSGDSDSGKSSAARSVVGAGLGMGGKIARK